MPDYDLPTFAAFLLDKKPGAMLFYVEEELERIAQPQREDPAIGFRRKDYERKLHRLRTFLRTGRFPGAMTPKEQASYEQIAASLLACGALTQRRSGPDRRCAGRRVSSAGYLGTERRSGSDRRSGSNRRAIHLFK